MYYFIYYTSTITLQANVEWYEVDFFSKTTATKLTVSCPEKLCVIPDISPFEYNISFSKSGYETQTLWVDIPARSSQNFSVELVLKTSLDAVTLEEISESPRQAIERIREDNFYYQNFRLTQDRQVGFREEGDVLQLVYTQDGVTQDIQSVPFVAQSDVLAENIYNTDNIFISLGSEKYIFNTARKSLKKIPIELEILYIKSWKTSSEYLIVTEKWVFVYNSNSNTLDYEYQFKDFVYAWENLIGVVYSNEEQKRKNFNLTDPWNLIIRYSQRDKSRKVIYATKDNIEKIFLEWEKIILITWEGRFELKNF